MVFDLYNVLVFKWTELTQVTMKFDLFFKSPFCNNQNIVYF